LAEPIDQAAVGAVVLSEPVAVEPNVAGVPFSSPPSKLGRPAEIPTEHVCCPHQGCRGYGKFGGDPEHWIVGNGTYTTETGQKRQMLRCQWCQRPFSETQGTILFHLKTPSEKVFQVLKALAEGNGIRATGRIFGVKPDTVLRWLRRAGQHSQAVSAYLIRNIQVSQVQLDELWTFVRKKEKTLSAWEKLHSEYGDTWIWVAFDPVSKLVLALVIGEREQRQADSLLGQLKARLVAGCTPLFTSDQLSHYAQAILRVFGRWVQPPRKGSRGPHPKPRPVAPAELQYATVNKQRKQGRVVAVTTKVVYGSLATIESLLQNIAPGMKINTSFVERMNLSFRHLVSRLRRRALNFSKKRAYLISHLHLATAYYHFVLPHGSLRRPLPEPIPTRGTPKIWQKCTPAMEAGLTDHIWTMEELFTFHLPPP
jgi:IS1 family transposase/transposase-like protein